MNRGFTWIDQEFTDTVHVDFTSQELVTIFKSYALNKNLQ